MRKKIRIASLQYFIRPVSSFLQFEEQVSALVETAKGYKCRMVVFPEYFTTQLLTLGNVKRPIQEQISDLADQEGRFVEMMGNLSKKFGIHIVAGTLPVWSDCKGMIHNRCHVFAPNGKTGFQNKLHMTRFEAEHWKVSSGAKLKIFESDFGKFSVNICYDVEFPEIARIAALKGAELLVVPSCTDDRMGFYRVRHCAQARAIENQFYVIHSGTVGSLPQVPAVSLNYGQASILTPCDYSFARDGVLAEGIANQESMVIGEMDLDLVHESRTDGTTLPLRDSADTQRLIAGAELVAL